MAMNEEYKAIVQSGTIRERFWRKVEIIWDADSCWSWTAARLRGGYGRISGGGHSGPVFLAHRVSWVLSFGAIPSGLQVLHQCDNPRCVRPAHLFLGTQHDNVRDMLAKGRWQTPRGERNGRHILTLEMVNEIRARSNSGEKPGALSREFGVCPGAIGHIRAGRNWRRLTPESADGR